jgi:hypothetical protein
MAAWKWGIPLVPILAAAVAAGAADGRTYVTGHFTLDLQGVDAGSLSKVEGGDIEGEVSTSPTGTKVLAGTIVIGDVTLSFRPPVHARLQAWINDALEGVRSPRDAASIFFSGDGKQLSVDRFDGALVTELAFPALDGDAKDAAAMTLRIQPASTSHRAGSGEKSKDAASSRHKPWTPSAFRLSLADLPTANVARVEPFCVRVPPKGPPTATDNPNGDPGTPPPVKVGNLEWTIIGPDVDAWAAWFEDFVVRGKNADPFEKEGAIQILDDAGAVILTVKLSHVGIFGMKWLPPVQGKGGDPLQVLKVHLYVEAMRLE